MIRTHFRRILLPVLALAGCTGLLQAAGTATQTANPTALSLSCDTLLGPSPSASVKITMVTGTQNITVTQPSVTAPAVVPIVITSAATLPATATVPATFTFRMQGGCQGATNGQQVVLTFNYTGGTALTVTATLSITNSGSALAPSPAAVFLTCTKNGSTLTPGSGVPVLVTSTAYQGTPFLVDTTVNTLPTWLQVTNTSGSGAPGGTATPAGFSLTVAPTANCGNLGVGTQNFNVHLTQTGTSDKLLPVTIQVGVASAVSATPTTVNLTFQKGSNTYTAHSTVLSTSTNVAQFVSVDTTTLQPWFNVTAGASGTVGPASGTTLTVSFAPTSQANSLSPGTYTQVVHVKETNFLDVLVTVNLQVSNQSSTLSVAEGTTRTITYTPGGAMPSLVITPVSSDSPIPFTVTVQGATTVTPAVSITQGLAYSFGSPIAVTFSPAQFAGFTVGQASLTGTVNVVWSGGTIPVVINLTVLSPQALISSALPNTLPTGASQTLTVGLSGSGFVASNTVVGIMANGSLVVDSNVTGTVTNPSTMLVTINVPSGANADPLLPFSAAGSITLGVCNPVAPATTCSSPASGATVRLTIGVNPIISTVASASSFLTAQAPLLLSVSPYDILSLFGNNFCISGGTGCTSTMFGKTDPNNPATLRYVTALSPASDVGAANPRNLTVTFQTHQTPAAVIATAPLLFATNNQINLLVPEGLKLSQYANQPIDIVVSFGYGTGGTMLTSAPYTVLNATSDPGVFTAAGDGQGDAAALENSNYAVITTSAPAIARATGTDSDIVDLYLTGMGVPDSTTSLTPACMRPIDYFAAVDSATGATLTADDGLVIQNSLLGGALPPCLQTSSFPTVNIGGQQATVMYAGWVSGSIAGLYQVTVQLPATNNSGAVNFMDSTGTSGVLTQTVRHLPISVQMAGSGPTTPAGATLPVITGLLLGTSNMTTCTVSNVSYPCVTATHGQAVGGSPAVTGADGGGALTYSVAGGSASPLPTGVTLGSSTGAIGGTVGGSVSAGTTLVTIQVTDGTLTNTIVVAFNIS